MHVLAPAVAGAAATPTPAEWDDAIRQAVDGEVPVNVHFQPIADLHRGAVAGYESLARFGGAFKAGPDRWFHEAGRRGCADALEAKVLTAAFAAFQGLPDNTFLSINVSPSFLASPGWAALVDQSTRLDRLVIEVTEHSVVDDYAGLGAVIAAARRRGALLAVDDAGAGYASLQHVMKLRPDFVKLDRDFIVGCDADAARAAMIEAFGSLAAKLDAWIVAEGVETSDELLCLMRLGVPLAQGWLLARPAPEWADIGDEPAALIGSFRRRAVDRASVGSLLSPWPYVMHGDTTNSPLRLTLLLDRDDRPIRWAGLRADAPEVTRPLIAKLETPIRPLAARAMTRPEQTRFLPIVCTDEQGRYLGVIRIDDLVSRLAAA